MYHLIWRTTMEACMATAQYLSLSASITAHEGKQYRYSTEKVVFPGWKAVAGYEEDNPIYEHLLSLKKNAVVEYKKVESKVSMKELKSHYTEAKLIALLEQRGIGRPSTFSALLDKIQERGYVKKENVQGKKISCTDYVLEEDAIEETISQREFGNEKGKLVVQPTGYLVVEFLIKHFPDLFDYGYTKQMEDRLDKIAKAEEIWHNLCRECYQDIQLASRELVSNKVTIPIDEYHTYIIGKYGPVIKYNPTGDKKDITFKSVKKDIDMEALKRGDLKFEDYLLSENYYLTNLDIWLLARLYNLGIAIISRAKLIENNDYILPLVYPENGEYYFISVSRAYADKIPKYKLIVDNSNNGKLSFSSLNKNLQKKILSTKTLSGKGFTLEKLLKEFKPIIYPQRKKLVKKLKLVKDIDAQSVTSSVKKVKKKKSKLKLVKN